MKKIAILLIFFGLFNLMGEEKTISEEVIQLPPPVFKNDHSLFDCLKARRSSRDFKENELSLQEIANILWSANGINREDGKRTAPSARNAQDIEIYAVLPDGIYLYDPLKNQLLPKKKGDLRQFAGVQDYVRKAPLNLVYVSDLSKLSFARERESQLVTAAIDAGHCSQNVYLYVASCGLGAVVRTSIDRQKFAELLQLPVDKFFVVMAQTIGYVK